MPRILCCGLVAALAVASVWDSPPARARELDIAKLPLFIASSGHTNMIVTVDDSGSMRAGFLPEGMDFPIISGASRVPLGVPLEVQADLATNAYDGRCSWQAPFFYSVLFNKLYYNPALTYGTPLKPDGTHFPSANFNAAWEDGFLANTGGNAATVDLNTQYQPTLDADWEKPGKQRLEHATALAGVSDCNIKSDNPLKINVSDMTTNERLLIYPYATFNAATGAWETKAFWYERTGLNTYIAHTPSTAAEQQNFANWFSYYRTRALAARGALSNVMAGLDPSLRIMWQVMTEKPGTTVVGPSTPVRSFSGQQRNDFFNWLYNISFNSYTLTRRAMLRAGAKFSQSANNETSPYYDNTVGSELACWSNFHVTVTDGFWNENNPIPPGGTDPTGLGDQMIIPADPATFPFGYAPDAGAESKIYWNREPSPALGSGTNNTNCKAWPAAPAKDYLPAPTEDPYVPCDPTLADIAFYYWATDLRPDLPNIVPQRWADFSTGFFSGTAGEVANAQEAIANAEVFFNPKNDPANWQHMVNYMIMVGVKGIRTFPDDYNDLRRGQTSNGTIRRWPYVRNASTRGVDDSWHATVNSRGKFMSVEQPQELQEALNEIANIVVRANGSAAVASVSSSIAAAGSYAVKTGYDTTDWSGWVRAYAVDQSGLTETVLWDAGAELEKRTPDSRVIFTSNTANGSQGIPFRWNNLSADWQTALHRNPGTDVDDGLGQQRLEYLRGDHSQEINQGGPFRQRVPGHRLGPIMYSAAAIVAAPAGVQTEHDYAQFRNAHLNRRRVAYIAANDGMLHAFDGGTPNATSTGRELWAYVPYRIRGQVAATTRPGGGFEPSVDSTPAVRDVYFNGQWHTLLVGSYRRGGQGIYALDITDPDAMSTEAAAASRVLWEFSDELSGAVPDAAELGYTFGKANIVQLTSGEWVVLLTSGFNKAEADGHAGTDTSMLFVLRASDGTLLKTISFPSGFGINSVTTVDDNNDGKDEEAIVADAIGNVWSLNISSPSMASWPAPVKLFEPDVAEANPITTAVRVIPDRLTGGVIYLFGTGKLIEPSDRAVAAYPTQHIVAVRDRPANYPVHLSDLVSRTLAAHTSAGGATYYTIAGANLADADKGWVLPLSVPGERVVTTPAALFSHGLALIYTTIPGSSDPCRGGLSGNYYVLDAASGNSPELGAIFDTNADGVVTANDNPSAVGLAVPVSGVEGTPGIMTLAGGGVANIAGVPGVQLPAPPWRRRMWRELP